MHGMAYNHPQPERQVKLQRLCPIAFSRMGAPAFDRTVMQSAQALATPPDDPATVPAFPRS